MPTTLKSIRAVPLTASFAAMYGGEDRIPEEVRKPSSHFQSIPRRGQFTTIVFAECSDGQTGIGECFGLPTPHAAAAFVNHVIAPALEGKPLRAPSEMLADVRRYLLALGHNKGPAMEAISGVDIALWDLTARRNETSLAQALGGEVMALPTYVSPVPFLTTPAETAAAAVQLVSGFQAVKLKVGRGAALDIRFIAAVREAIGPERKLMLDANCAYTFDEAATLLDEIKRLDIAWLEEPLPPDDLAGLRKLSERSEIPIAGGENEFTVGAIAALIDEAGIGIVQPNISRAGGVSGLLDIHRIAEQRGAKIAPHGVGGSVVMSSTLHCGAVMPGFLTFEVNRLPNPLRDDLGATPTITDGFARPSDGPGHGVTINADQINRFSEAA